MLDESTGIHESTEVSCHLQVVAMGGLKCRAAAGTSSSKTDDVTREMCMNCDVGKIYREIGCDVVTARITILRSLSGGYQDIDNIFCSLRKRDVDLESCRKCGLVTAETTREIMAAATGLFEAQGFYSPYKNLEDARKALRDGNYDHAITQSAGCLESTMKCIHDELGEPLPSSKDITGLWKSTRGLLRFDEIEPTDSAVKLVNVLHATVTAIGGLRNSLGDAHGKGTIPPEISENIAELSINTCATLSTMIIRRYVQLRREREK